MPPGDSVLVSVQRGDDAAAVIADSDGRLWIAHGHARAAQPITLLDGLQPGQVGGDGWTAVGGALPPDAQRAQALGSDGTWQRAAIGGGAWVAFVVADERHPLPPVRFRDERGAIVSRADARRLAAARRIDAAEAERIIWPRGSVGGVCPVCEQRDWRGSPAAGGFGEYVFCGTCGHGDGDVIGAWSPAATSSPDEL